MFALFVYNDLYGMKSKNYPAKKLIGSVHKAATEAKELLLKGKAQYNWPPH